jgi:dynein heavy chain
MSGDGPKWILLDGDIDPMWIESLNTVMDDNKVLTLASNERIALTKTMRLIFEIASLRTATPATVSRAGILYINPQDLGWNPYVSDKISGCQVVIAPEIFIVVSHIFWIIISSLHIFFSSLFSYFLYFSQILKCCVMIYVFVD